MTPEATAAATAEVVGDLPSRFMLDMDTYVAAAADGFQGADFYVAGRGGALGDVPASVVAATFVFFEPTFVHDSWARAGEVMSRQDAADRWAAAGHRWAAAHLGDDVDWTRLATLVGRVNAAASTAAVPSFGAWRDQPEPEADRAEALALHRLMVLRELRGGLHGAAVVAQGVSPQAAVTLKTPGMLPIFGWSGPAPEADDPACRTAWDEAEAATDRALATAYAALDEGERAELCDLLDAARASAT